MRRRRGPRVPGGEFAFADSPRRAHVGGVKIHLKAAGPIQTNAYLLTEPKTGEAVLIDAPLGITDIIRPILAKEGCKLTELWLTHGHFDHMQDAARLKRELGVRVTAHREDQPLIETPEIMEGFMGAKLGLEGVKVDRWVGQGDKAGTRV